MTGCSQGLELFNFFFMHQKNNYENYEKYEIEKYDINIDMLSLIINDDIFIIKDPNFQKGYIG